MLEEQDGGLRGSGRATVRKGLEDEADSRYESAQVQQTKARQGAVLIGDAVADVKGRAEPGGVCPVLVETTRFGQGKRTGPV